MDFDTQIKLAIYRHFAETGRRPSPGDVAELAGSDAGSVLEAYPRLRAQKVLALEAEKTFLMNKEESIRIADESGLAIIVI
jgi:hypothetical protein